MFGKATKNNTSSSSQPLLIESLEARQLLSSSVTITPSLVFDAAASSGGTIEGYTPAEIKKAYGISSISFAGVTGTGAGQTIAIVDAYSDPNIAADLAVFDKEFSLSAQASFKQISSTGSTSKLPSSSADWDEEISLDVEWAHAVAPKANIVLVDASTDSLSALMAAVKYARTISSVSVISMSWGSSEFSGETAYDQYFTTPSGHIGITFVAASGDDGASAGAEWPASSPNVLSVGGTTLSLSSTGTVESESAWSDSSGGVSSYESTPSYQSSVSSTGRSVPDVSYDADPDTGFAVYDSVSDDGYVGWQEVGGTSAGTPQWAALIAIADQGRVANGLATLDGATGTLPAIYSIYSNSASYAADFTDITSGSSVLSEGGGGFGGFGGPGGFGRGRGRQQEEVVSATTGYDTLTGVGTPKATSLIEALASTKVSNSAVTKTTTTATAAKSTKAKASDALEIVAAASVPGYGRLASASVPTLLPHEQSSLEIESTTAPTAAVLISKPISPDSVMTAKVIGGSAPFAVDSDAAESTGDAESLFAQTPIVALASATPAAEKIVGTEEVAVSAAAGAVESGLIFTEKAVERSFRDALDHFRESCAVPPIKSLVPRQSSPTVAESIAFAIDAAFVGYVYLNRRKNARHGSTSLIDERSIAPRERDG